MLLSAMRRCLLPVAAKVQRFLRHAASAQPEFLRLLQSLKLLAAKWRGQLSMLAQMQ